MKKLAKKNCNSYRRRKRKIRKMTKILRFFLLWRSTMVIITKSVKWIVYVQTTSEKKIRKKLAKKSNKYKKHVFKKKMYSFFIYSTFGLHRCSTCSCRVALLGSRVPINGQRRRERKEEHKTKKNRNFVLQKKKAREMRTISPIFWTVATATFTQGDTQNSFPRLGRWCP